jgi:taurine dioxygenase
LVEGGGTQPGGWGGLEAVIEVEPLTATIGAEIGGVDLADDLADDVIDELRDALLDWKVIFFRDQHRLERTSHIAFGRRFGELEVHPLTPAGQEQPEVFVIPAGGKFRAPDNWHSDVTWRPEPSLGSILRAIELPPLGGDTLWADMGKAYDLLDDDTKERIDGRTATHDYASAFGRGSPPEVQEKMRAEHPTAEHPIVRTHPETGRKTLYVNRAFTRSIVGLDDVESRSLLERLYRQSTIVDVQCRFRWRPGSVAFWDNRATQHVVSNDFLPAKRIMERVTIVGDKPY